MDPEHPARSPVTPRCPASTTFTTASVGHPYVLEREMEEICNFYGLNEDESTLNALQTEEPEFYDVEMTLETGASTHAADRVDFPGYDVEESPGSNPSCT